MIETKNELEQKRDYLSSLKSLETENYVDRIFYRPIGYKIARRLAPTGITPNTITYISILIGVLGGALFYYETPYWAVIIGILLLVSANVLDCVDGQLARLTGIKSEIGRILDGVAGYFWFFTLYIALATRLYHATDSTVWYYIAFLSMASHALQAGITDYYKTIHLRFISSEKGAEFETYQEIKERVDAMPNGFKKFVSRMYSGYTWIQNKLTPSLGEMVLAIREHGSTGDQRLTFRKVSMIIMRLLNLLTFNGRTIPLFIIALTGSVQYYFLYEIIFLNIVLGSVILQHEALCRWITEEVKDHNEDGATKS
ncbi:MAG: CDP-alcohol phosphatidyltransferase family protein [Porphyromonas sp.]|nr:CDP-alcohol phosphatidyltransferase family protein [Porphyromonas sp.]